MKKTKISTKMLVTLAMLLAIEIVLSRFLSIQTPITRIGFGFIPLVMAGILFGPIPAAIVAVLADVLGALLFPTGAYYPPLTITSLLVGLTYGLFLHKISFNHKDISDWLRIVGCVVVRQGIWALLLQSYWLSLLQGITYKQCLVTRVPQVLILAVVEIIVIPILVKVADMLKKAMHLQ